MSVAIFWVKIYFSAVYFAGAASALSRTRVMSAQLLHT